MLKSISVMIVAHSHNVDVTLEKNELLPSSDHDWTNEGHVNASKFKVGELRLEIKSLTGN